MKKTGTVVIWCLCETSPRRGGCPHWDVAPGLQRYYRKGNWRRARPSEIPQLMKERRGLQRVKRKRAKQG